MVREIDLPIEKVHYWTDSTLTLQYIKNTQHRLKVFIANPVSEILQTSDAADWSHIPGEINPADMVTRGIMKPEKLMESRWFTAPQFLEKEEDYWAKLQVDKLDEEDAEIKRRPLFLGLNLVEVQEMNFDRISNWIRLLRVAAWVIRFAENCLHKERKMEETLALEELQQLKNW